VPPHARPLVAVPAAVLLAACSGSAGGGTGVARVTVSPAAAALCIGDTLTFKAKLLDASGDTVTGATVRWASSSPDTVSVDSVSGLARALAFGTAQITASVGALKSAAPGQLDAPPDLVVEAVPDTVVLAPGDTFTVGARLRRVSAGPVPSGTPVIAPLDTAPASITAAGLVTGKAAGTATFSLAACGFTGHGAAQVYTPPNSLTGTGYLWLSGPVQLRYRLATSVKNFRLTGGKPAFQVFGFANPKGRSFAYEDSLQLQQAAALPLDSIGFGQIEDTLYFCHPTRPFAVYGDSAPSSLLSMRGGSAAVTTFSTSSGFQAVSGRASARMRGFVGGSVLSLDTLQVIFTFSAPLRDTTGVCP